MGISDYHIRKIKDVSESTIYCPQCGKKNLYLETETGDFEDFDISYCPRCKIFFEYDDGYFTAEDTEGLDKLKVKRREYGLLIAGFKKPIYFDSVRDRSRFIRKINRASLTYTTFSKEMKP